MKYDSKPEVRSEIHRDGSMTVVHDFGERGQTQWDIKPQQIAHHLRGINDKEHPFNKISRGTLEAALDAHEQFKKEPMR